MRRILSALAALTTVATAHAQTPQFLRLDARTLVGRRCYCGETTQLTGTYAATEGILSIVALSCESGRETSLLYGGPSLPFKVAVGSTACYRWLLIGEAGRRVKVKGLKVERLEKFTGPVGFGVRP